MIDVNNEDEVSAVSAKCQTEIHPLMRGNTSFAFPNWQSWVKRFETTHFEEMPGLIHIGFDVPIEFYSGEQRFKSERVIYYLRIADGHRSHLNFRESAKISGGGRSGTIQTVFGNKTIEEVRQDLAQRAFKVLADKFFKNNSALNLPSWLYPIVQPGVLKAVLDFFDLDTSTYPRIKNFSCESKEHYHMICGKFLHDLCDFAWKCEDVDLDWRELDPHISQSKVLRVFRPARPRIARIMIGLGITHRLLQTSVQVDDYTFASLERFVMHECDIKLPNRRGGRRKFANLEQAVWAGIPTAYTLLCLKCIMEQREILGVL